MSTVAEKLIAKFKGGSAAPALINDKATQWLPRLKGRSGGPTAPLAEHSNAPGLQTLTERISIAPAGGGLRVDRERGVISRVKVLGGTSANGREYPVATMRAAAPLYEGAPVNINHSSGPRNYEDRVGHVVNVKIEGDGLRADLHFNPKHAIAEQLAWDAEHAPHRVGLSHVVTARTASRGGKIIVEEITRVQSVDLVADPATTGGLFESRKGDELDSNAKNNAAAIISDYVDWLLMAATAPAPTTGAAKKKMAELLRDFATKMRGFDDEAIFGGGDAE